MELLLHAVTQLGLSIALVVFFVWQSWKREERLACRITNLEESHKQTLETLVVDATECMRQNTTALRRLMTVVESCDAK